MGVMTFGNVGDFHFLSRPCRRSSLLDLVPGMNSSCKRAGSSTVLSVCLANEPMWDIVRGVKTLLEEAAAAVSAGWLTGIAPVSGETRQTQQISAETVNPLTQHEEGEGTN